MTSVHQPSNTPKADIAAQDQNTDLSTPLSPLAKNAAMLRGSGVHWQAIERKDSATADSRSGIDWMSANVSQVTLPSTETQSAEHNINALRTPSDTGKIDFLSASVSHIRDQD